MDTKLIQSDPSIMMGKPVVAGTRITVELILEKLAAGETISMTADDAEELRGVLLEAIKTHEGQLGRRDAYGQRYVVDFMLVWRSKQAMIRSAWIIEHDSDTPRLTSCYPL